MARQRRSSRRSGKQFVALATAAASALGSVAAPMVQASGTTLNWNGSAGDGLWATPGNWTIVSGADPVPADGDIAQFNLNSASTSIAVGSVSLNTLSFGDTTAYTLNSGTLSLDTTGGITLLSANGATQTLASTLAIALGTDINSDSFTFANNSTVGTNALIVNGGISGTAAGGNVDTLNLSGTGNMTLAGVISNGAGGGTVSLVQSSTGTTTLSGASTFTGGLKIQGGTVVGTTSANAFGASSNVITLGLTGGSSATLLEGTTGLTIANPIVLASSPTGTLTIGNTNNILATTFSGGVTGANSLTINNTSTAASTITFSTALLNNAGTIKNTGTSTGATTISFGVGSNVTSLIQASNSSPFTDSGTLVVNSGGTTLTSTGTAALTVSGAISGTGNLILNDNSTGAINVGAGAVNNVGTIINSGTGTGLTTISGVIGTSVTGLNVNSGTLLLTGVNTFTSATTIASGATLRLGIANALAVTTGGVTVSSGGTLDINSFNALGQKTVTISGTGVGGLGAFYNSSATDQTNGVQTLVMAANSTVGGAGRLDDRANGGTATLNMGGFTLTTAMTGGKYFALVSSTVSNPGNIIISTGGVSLELTTNLAGSSTNSITVNNGAFLNYYGFTGTDAWTHIMQAGSKIQTNNGAAASTVSGPLTLNGAVTISPVTGDTLALTGAITGAGSMTLNTGGAFTLSNTNNLYAGGTSVSLGTLNVTGTGASGVGPVTLSGGTVNNNATGGIFGNISQTGGTFAQTGPLVTGQSFTISAGTATFSQANTYTGGTTLSGTGTLNVTAASALPGVVTMTGGTLSSSVATAAANTGNINQSGGVLTSAVAGGQFGAVSASASAIINPGGVGVIGTGPLTISSLTTASGATLQFDILAPWSGTPSTTGDLLNVSSGFKFGSGTNIRFSSGNPATPGDYRLIQFTGPAPSLSNFSLPAAPTGETYSLNDTTADPGFIDLIVSPSYTPTGPVWIPSAAGTFSWNSAANWTIAIPHLTGDTANFGTLTGSETVPLDAAQHIGTLNLNPTGTTNTYTISTGTGGVLFLDNGASAAQVTNTTGNNAISAPVTLLSSNSNFNIASATTLTLSGLVSGAGGITLATGATSGGTLALTTAGTNTFTGGLNVNSGTVVFTTAGQLSSGPITLNGGTLNQNSGGSVTLVNSSLTVLAGGGTLTDTGVYAGKLFFPAGFIQGSGTLTKTGTGDLQITTPQPGYTGNWLLTAGNIESQAPGALGTGSVTISSGADLDISNVAVYNTNAIILQAGGQFSAENASIAYGGSLNVTGAATIGLRNNYATNSAGNNISLGGALSGSGSLTLVGSTTTTTYGMFAVGGGSSGYTGTSITVGAQTALGVPAGGIGAAPASTTITVQSGGYLGLVADGDGTSSIQTLTYNPGANPIIFSTGNGGYIVGKSGATGTFNQEANKIILYNGNLTPNATNAFNVTPQNGYGLELDPVLTATTTYTVNGTQASNVVPGLILTNLTGGFGIVKAGTGTLQLGTSAADASNTFGPSTATAAAINVTAGTVSAFSDQNLGLSTNGITLNNTTSAEFLALASFATSRLITISSATGASIGVASAPNNAGPYTLTLNTGLAYGAVANTLTKVEDGTLILAAAATGAPTSGTTISAGALQPFASSALGSGTITLANAIGASLQLTTGTTFTQPLNLSNFGIQGKGALESASGANIYATGAITIANPAAIGVDSGSTLTISSAITETGAMTLVGAGTGTISTAITGTGGLNVFAPGGTWNITGATATTNLGTVTVDAGTLSFNGAGLNGSGGVIINYGSTLNYDDTISTNVLNRNNSHTQQLGAGTLQLLGASNATSSETFFGINFQRGEDVINAVANGTGQANITLTATGGAFTHAALSSAVFEGTGLGSTDAVGAGLGNISIGAVAATFQGTGAVAGTAAAPVINKGILPWALAINTTSGTTTFATADATTVSVIRNMNGFESISTLGAVQSANLGGTTVTTNGTTTVTDSNTTGLVIGQTVYGPGIPAGATITAINPNTSFTLSAAATTSATSTVAFLSTADNITLPSGANNLSASLPSNGLAINSLTLGAGASLTLNTSPQTLTIGGAQGGGILALDTTGANTISGGIITAGANELDIHTPAGVNLTISSNITGGAGAAGVGLTKGESGTLTLTGTAFYVGQTVVNAGTLSLSGPNTANTIQYTNFLELGAGATLNLNANTQIVQDLFTDSISVGTGLGFAGNNGIVTGTTGAMLIVDQDASRTFTGSIQGAVSFVHTAFAAGATDTLTQNSTYTGITLISGGGVTLNGAGQLSGTTGLTINQASLTLDNNTGSQDMPTRLNPSLTGITLNGGTLSYIGRTQYMSASTALPAITALGGANVINSTVQTTGVASAVLPLTSLSRSLGATINFTNTGGTLGTIGTNPNILINSIATNTPATGAGSILSGGEIVNGADFAAYNVSYGVGALGTTGFAGYSPNLITSPSAGDNILLSFNPGASLGATSINSLKVNGASNITFASGGGLNLASGGFLTATTGAVNVGNVINNGTLTTTGPELFVYNGNTGTTTINSVITGTGVSLVKSGSGPVTIAGTNTVSNGGYTGGTYVDQGTLTLANSGNVTTGLSTLGTGGIFLNGGTLVQTAGGVIPSQPVTIFGSGVLTLNANNAVANGVTTAGSNIITVPNTNGIAVGQLVTGTGIPSGEYVTAVNPANNTVTITTGGNVTAGTNTITFLVNNTLSSLTYSNTGGTAAPTVTGNTLLTLTGGITASSINVGDTSVLAGTVSLANQASPTITVNPINPNGQNIAPLAPTLNISALLEFSSNPVTVNGGGVLQLSAGTSTFQGGVNLASGTSLLLGASTAGSGTALTGPVGAGTLTVGSGSSLLTTNSSPVINNNVTFAAASAGAGGNVTFDIFEPNATNTAETLTLGSIGGIGNITLPNGAGTGATPIASTILNVNAPQMTVALSGNISGTNAAIVKNGPGTLVLNGNNSFDTGVTINNGTLLATGLTSLGSGTVTINGGVLQLHNNGGSTGGVINFGNNVTINSNLSSAFIDVNTNGGTFTANTIVMGALNYASLASPSPTNPTTVLNVTGGNGYGLRFQSTNLSNATAPVDVSVASGITLTLPGSAFTLANAPVNIGPGTLLLPGASFNTGGVTITGTQLLSPVANGTGYVQNTTGALALSAGSTLQIVPVVNTSTNPLTNSGYTTGGLQGKYVNYTGTTNAILSAGASSIPGAAVLPGQYASDSSFNVRPNGEANAGTFASSMAFYNGLININKAGTYTFQSGSDDAMQLVVDGVTVFQQLDNSTGGQAVAVGTPITVNLSAGFHAITLKGSNQGGGGGVFLLYGGPDTASGTTTLGLQETGGAMPPLVSIPLTNLAYQNAPSTATYASSAYGNAAQVSNAVTLANNTSATIDGLGSDLNSTIAGLTLGGGTSVLTINNLGGQGTIGVLGTTTLQAAGQTITTGTGTLYLIGGVTDGGFGFTKAGNGTLILGPSFGTFTGNMGVTAGFLQVTDPSSLTSGTTTISSGATLDLNGVSNLAGNITLNGTGFAKFATAPAALYNSNAVAASTTGNTTIGTAATAIGGYGNIMLSGTLSDAGLAWTKVGPDMLTLSGTNTLTATGTIAGGILQAGSTGALGTGAGGITVNGGAALDLNGVAVADGTRTITISGAGIVNGGGVSVTGGYGTYNNTLASLFNSSTTSAASVSGPVVLGAAANVGNNVLTGNNASAAVPIAAVTPGNGDVSLGGVVSGAFVLTKVGSANLFLTNAANTFTGFQVNEGTLVMNGSGAFTAAANTNTISAGGSLILDNVGTPVNSRLGSRGDFVAGYLTILGNSSTAVTETIGSAGSGNNLNAIYGQSIVTLDAQSGAPLTLNFTGTSTSPVTQSGTGLGTMEIIGTNLGLAAGTNGNAAVTDNAGTFAGVGQNGANNTANQGIIPSTLAINSTSGAAGFASLTATTAGLLQPLTVTGGIATLTAADNVFASSALTAPNTGVTSINSLTLLSGGSLAIGAGNTISIQSGGLLVGNSTTSTGVNATISGAGTLTTNALNIAFYAHVLAGNTLTLSTNLYLNGGSGFAKADGGTLVLQGNSNYNGVALQSPVNFNTTYSVNAGTLQLAGGNQTLFQTFETVPSAGNIGIGTQGQTIGIQFGATLDLNGTNQVLQVVNEGNATQLTGGSVINSNASTSSTLRLDPNANVTWSGNISGAGAGTLNLVRDGNNTYTINSPQTYTGTSTFEGGATNLVDLATLQGTSQIDIRRAVLRWDNTGYTAMSNRLTNANTSAIPTIYLDGGAFEFQSRTGVADTATIGNVVVNSGSSIIQVQSNGGSAQLNIGTVTRNVGTDLVYSNTVAGASNANLGSFADNPHLYFATNPTLINGIIGGYAVVLGEDIGQGGTIAQASFATYDPTGGLRPLATFNEVGAGNNGNIFVVNGNTRLTGSQTLAGTFNTTTTTTINSLTMSGAITLSYVNPTDVLAIQSGGVLSGLDANNRAIGQAQGFGNLTTAAGQQELFLHNGNNTLSVNANITDNGSPVALVLDGLNVQGPVISLFGNNTYTGTTYVNGVITNLSSLNSGGTAISSTSVIISGSTNSGVDSMAPGNAAVVLQANNQINASASVTLLGGGELNTNGFNTTINNLTFTNDGGDGNTTNGPAVFTYGTNSTTTVGTAGTAGGAGVLTIAGTLSATTVGVSNPNSLPNIADAFTIPVINGQIAFTSSTPTIYVDPNNTPGQIGLEINNIVITNGNNTAITKTGTGVLGLGGQQTAFVGGINVTAGTLAFGAANSVFGGSQVNLSSAAILDTRALTGTIGSLTGSGTVENYNLGTAGTLQTGMDNTNTTFSGVFASPFSSGLLNVTKIGSGTFALTGVSTGTNNGTLTAGGGTVAVNTTGQVSFTTETLNTGGVLLLDNSVTPVNNRLGTSFQFVSQAIATANTAARTLNFQGGTLNVQGNFGTAVSEGLGNVNIAGGGTLILSAAGTGGVNATINSLQNQTQTESLLIMGDGLGAAAGPNVATLTATTVTFRGGTTNTPGSTTLRIREDIVADTSSTDTTFTGTGVGFLTADTTTNLFRPLNQSTELAPITGALTTTTNVGVASASGAATSVNPGTITLESSGGGVSSTLLPGNPFSAAGALLNLTLSQGGVLAQPGNTGITFGELTNGDTLDIHVLGAGVLNLNAPLNDSNGLIKADSGTLVFQQPYYSTGSQNVAVNGGTLKLAAGNNTIFTQATVTVPTTMTLAVNNGTLDLNGNSQLLNTITSTNPLPYGGGTAASPNIFINNSAATPVNLVTATGTNSTFSGVIENTGGGALSFFKQGGGLLTLTSPSTYTGSTNVQGGSLILQSMGSIANTSAINVNNNTFTWDDTGLQAVSNRIGSTAAINLFGVSTVSILGREGVDNVNLNAVNVGAGAATFTETNYNSNTQTGVLNVTASSLAPLSGSNGGTINFVPTTGTFGAVGGTSHFFIGNAPVLANGIIGGWAIVNGADFASYSTSQGVGALASGGTFAGYSGATFITGGAAGNVSVGASVNDTNTGSNALNSVAVRAPAAVTIVSLANPTELLSIQTGGLLVNDSGNKGVTFTAGQITSGLSSAATNLYAYINSNTTTITSQIVNNSAGGSVTLVKSGAGTLTLNPVYAIGLNVAATATTQTVTVPSTTGIPSTGSITLAGATAATYTVASATTITLNYTGTPTAQFDLLTTTTTYNDTYTGGTIVDQGTLNLAGAAGTVSIPGNVTVQGGSTLTETTNAGQIATTSNVTLNNNAALNLPAATNTFNSLTFNDNGSSTSLTLTIPTSQTLALTGASTPVITAINTNNATIPTITGTTATLALGASPTITTGGQAQESIVLNVPITVASGALTINGTGGAVVLGTLETAAAATTFAGGVNLNGTSGIILAGGSTPVSGTVTSGPLGTGPLTIGAGTGAGPTLQSASTGPFTLANAVNINGPVTLGGTLAANAVVLSGPITLANIPSINVPSNLVTESITGVISGSGFSKAGSGALTLTPTANNTFSGPVNITGGLLTLGNASALPATIAPDLTVGNGAAFNINAIATTIGSLSGGSGVTPTTSGGLVTNSGAAQTLTIAPTASNAQNAAFYGLIASANTSVIKAGTSTSSQSLELSSANWYTGTTTITSGALFVDGFNTALQSSYSIAAGATLGGGHGVTIAQILLATGKGVTVSSAASPVGASNPVGGPYTPANGGFFTAGNQSAGILNIALSPGATPPATGLLAFNPNSTYKVLLNGNVAGGTDNLGTGGYSQTIVGVANTTEGTVNIGTGVDLQVNFGPGYTVASAATPDYILDTNGVTGTFATVNGNTLALTGTNTYTATDPNSSFVYTLMYNQSDPNNPGFAGNDVSLSVQVPEPGTLGLLGVGALGLLARRRRRIAAKRT